MGSPRNATRKPSVSAASSYQFRPGSARGCAAKAAWTTHHVGAHALTVELLGNPLRPVGVVLDSRDAETAQRPALAEQAGQQHRADSAAELDDPAPPVEDDVVADGREPGRPHRGGAPWQVRPAQAARRSRAASSESSRPVGDGSCRSDTATADRNPPQRGKAVPESGPSPARTPGPPRRRLHPPRRRGQPRPTRHPRPHPHQPPRLDPQPRLNPTRTAHRTHTTDLQRQSSNDFGVYHPSKPAPPHSNIDRPHPGQPRSTPLT